MLDIRTIRENREAVRAGAEKKRIPLDLDRLLALDERRRALSRSAEDGKAEQKRRSKAVGGLAAEARAVELESLSALKARFTAEETELAGVVAEWEALMLRVPNLPAPEVPEGRDDTENVELRRVGAVPDKGFPLLDGARGRPKLDHEALARALAALSVYAAANAGRIRSIDVNPFLINTKLGVAVDGLIVLNNAAAKAVAKH